MRIEYKTFRRELRDVLLKLSIEERAKIYRVVVTMDEFRGLFDNTGPVIYDPLNTDNFVNLGNGRGLFQGFPIEIGI